MDRACPLCLDAPLRLTAQRGVMVHQCDRCHGHWLDWSDLEELAPDWKSEALATALAAAPGRCLRGGHAIPEGQDACDTCQAPAARCPTCLPEHPRLALVSTSACAVDVCGRCHGLWLDATELAALRRAVREAPSGAPSGFQPYQPSAHAQKDSSGGTGLKGFLGDLVGEVVLGIIVGALS